MEVAQVSPSWLGWPGVRIAAMSLLCLGCGWHPGILGALTEHLLRARIGACAAPKHSSQLHKVAI